MFVCVNTIAGNGMFERAWGLFFFTKECVLLYCALHSLNSTAVVFQISFTDWEIEWCVRLLGKLFAVGNRQLPYELKQDNSCNCSAYLPILFSAYTCMANTLFYPMYHWLHWLELLGALQFPFIASFASSCCERKLGRQAGERQKYGKQLSCSYWCAQVLAKARS